MIEYFEGWCIVLEALFPLVFEYGVWYANDGFDVVVFHEKECEDGFSDAACCFNECSGPFVECEFDLFECDDLFWSMGDGESELYIDGCSFDEEGSGWHSE